MILTQADIYCPADLNSRQIKQAIMIVSENSL